MRKQRLYSNGYWKWVGFFEEPVALSVQYYDDIETESSVITKFKIKVQNIIITGNSVEQLIYALNRLHSTFGISEEARIVIFCRNLKKIYWFLKHEKIVVDTFKIQSKMCTLLFNNINVELREITFIGSDRWQEFSTADTEVDKLYDFASIYWTKMVYSISDKEIYAPLTIQQVVSNRIKRTMSKEDKELVQKCFPKYASGYDILMKHIYIGGYCDAVYPNRRFEGTVGHVDFKSSYLAWMLTEDYPIGTWTKSDPANIDSIIKKYACIVKVTYKNLKSSRIKFLHDKRAYALEEAKLDCTRHIISAKTVTFYLTDLDFELVNMCYDYDDMQIEELYTCEKGRLPKSLRSVAEESFKAKETTTGVERLWAKLVCEIVYGATVKSLYNIDNKNWEDIKNQAYLSPYWGVWTTAYARYNLITMALQLGHDHLYGDTDSLFYLNPYMHNHLIESFNKNRKDKMRLYAYEEGLDPNIFEALGTFVYEDGSTYDDIKSYDFKAVGPKAYIYKTDKDGLITKIAGYKKQYMKNGKVVNAWENYFGDNDEIYDVLTPYNRIKDVITTEHYVDKPCEIELNGVIYKSKSYVYTESHISKRSLYDALVEAGEAEEELRRINKEQGREQR